MVRLRKAIKITEKSTGKSTEVGEKVTEEINKKNIPTENNEMNFY